jgi:predicted ATP-grasp superfamily ATP-dependent carboligase
MDLHDILTDFKLESPETLGKAAHAISVHIGWLNWSSVGDESFSRLVEHLDARKIAEFERPGDFYNFITYREHSLTYIDEEGIRSHEFPNTRVYHVARADPLNDLILVNLLEPTQFGEIYVDKVVALLKKLNVVRYQVMGAMGSPVPHTRPTRITGRSSDPRISEKLEKMGVRQTLGRQYQGPTSILNSVSSRLQDEGITTANIMAHMPSHLTLQEPDYTGVYSILSVISRLEEIDIPLDRIRSAGKRQYDRINKEVNQSQSLLNLSKELEEIYDQDEETVVDESVQLPPNIQKAIDEALGKE